MNDIKLSDLLVDYDTNNSLSFVEKYISNLKRNDPIIYNSMSKEDIDRLKILLLMREQKDFTNDQTSHNPED